MKYSCFEYEIKDKIAHISMCRPDEFNSMNKAFWSELPSLIEKISDEASATTSRILFFHTSDRSCDIRDYQLEKNLKIGDDYRNENLNQKDVEILEFEAFAGNVKKYKNLVKEYKEQGKSPKDIKIPDYSGLILTPLIARRAFSE